MTTRHAVYLEIASKRSFACAVDWPGWSRGGRSEEEALAALVAYGPRYGATLEASTPFTPPADVRDLDVVARVVGGSGTEFGVPGAITPLDERPVDDTELGRQRALLEAAWRAFDAATAAAATSVLRKGPRGGGRDLPKMVWHVLDAERAYLNSLGVRYAAPQDDDPAAAMELLRAASLKALTARARGTPLENPRGTKRPWPPRYFVRRSAWHALDHAWEIEDRAEPAAD
jgi:hypothetical protein